MASPNIVIATTRQGGIEKNLTRHLDLPGYAIHVITDREALNTDTLQEITPRYIFFPHWSWIIPKEIYERFECIIFHASDVPFGRGGSPIQNLISRGIYETKISALRATSEVDAGPVYLKQPLNIRSGSLEEIFHTISTIVPTMIQEIVEKEPRPVPQTGEPVVFPRRTPEQSEIPSELCGRKLYDFIRMLDAPTYPHAFMKYGENRYEFTRAILDDVTETVTAEVSIIPQKL